jgi:two-component system phosphate regulon sensor histidine kinase PhoR
MFAARVNTDHTHKIADIASQGGQEAGSRATVIDGNGKVLADSEIPIPSLEHEGRRPEILAALQGEIGTDIRKHNAFGVPVLYVAVPVSGGAVRLAYPLADIAIANTRARHVLLLGATIAVFAALAISALAAETVLRRRSP